MIPGKLAVQADGRLAGGASIAYNSPFPCRSHGTGSGAMNGVVMHTMVGNLPGCIAGFNDFALQKSAFFGIDQTGHVHQFIPVGLGYYSWAQEAGNRAWYSIEHADNGNPDNPLTDAQMAASAQVVECLSAFAGFPLAEADGPSERGYGVHYMGGASWGGHTCPDLPPNHVRSAQRPAILALAAQIRAGQAPPPPPSPQPPPTPEERATGGFESFRAAMHHHGMTVQRGLHLMAMQEPDGFTSLQRQYLDTGILDAPMPRGMTFWIG